MNIKEIKIDINWIIIKSNNNNYHLLSLDEKINECENNFQKQLLEVPYEERELTIKNTFNELMIRWKDTTLFQSNPEMIINNYEYAGIIALGIEVVPLILEDLAKHSGYWHVALEKITGENPTSDVEAGNIKEINQKWLELATMKLYEKLYNQIPEKSKSSMKKSKI